MKDVAKKVSQVQQHPKNILSRLQQHPSLGHYALIILGMTVPSASIIIYLLTGALSASLPPTQNGEMVAAALPSPTTGNSSISEPLPQPLPLKGGAEARNYVAYIPVPISDDEDSDEEYYEDDDEDDDEYYDDDDDDYYYEDEEEDNDVKPPRKRPSRKKQRRPSNRRRFQHPSKNSNHEANEERVPFLVPLMMVPESEIGIDKPFSFTDPKVPKRNIANDFAPDRPFGALPPKLNRRPPSGGIRNAFQPGPASVLPGNLRRPQRFNRRPDRRPRPINRRVLQDNQGLHDRPGPPYPGPNPRAPHLPLDKTIIHPTNHHPVYNLPPDSEESRPEEVEVVYVEPVKTTTITTTTTKAPTVIVLQQNPYPYNMFPHQQQQQYHYPGYPYHYPPPPMTTTTSTTTTTTPTTTTTTTKKPKRRRKKKRKKGQITYQNLAPDVLIDGILPPEPPNRPPGPALATRLKNNLITKRIGHVGHSQSSVINHIVPAPPMQTRRFRGNWQRSRRRLRPQAQRDPYLIQHSNVNYHNRRIHQNGIQGAFDDEFQNTFKHSQYPQPPRVPQAPPNIFSQGHPGGPGSQADSLPYNPTLPEHTIYVHPPTTTKPPIKRPPPQHPGVRVPGVEVPPHSGSIQDIIEAVDPNRYRRVELTNPNPTSYPGYRPPIGWKAEKDKEYNPQIPTNTYDYQRPANYYEAPVKVPNLTPNYYPKPTVIPPVIQQHTESAYSAYNPRPTPNPSYSSFGNIGNSGLHPGSQYGQAPSISDKIDNPTQAVNYNQQTPSHFFNEVNKMQPIVLNENHPQSPPQSPQSNYNYHSPYTTTSPPYRYDYQQPQSYENQYPIQYVTTSKPRYTSPAPIPNFINMNAVNSYTASMGTNSPSVGGQNAYTRRPMILSSSFGVGRPTGAYDPQRPDGPDYSTASKVDNPPPSHTFSSKNPTNPAGIPLNIGLDVYPIGNHKMNKLHTNRKTEHPEDNHQVKIHLNLLSSKPVQGQTSSQSFSIGPFSYNGNQRTTDTGRDETVDSKIQSSGSANPFFGNLDPHSVLKLLMPNRNQQHQAENVMDRKVGLISDPRNNNHRYESSNPSPSLNEVVNNDKQFQTQHQGQYSELQETLYDFHDRMDHHHQKKDQDYQYYDEYSSSDYIAQKPHTEVVDKAKEEYSNQQVDRLDVDYEYYEDEDVEAESNATEQADKDYDYVYYYYLDYIDNNSDLEKLPNPSYQKEEKVQ